MSSMNDNHKYDDIINLPHHISHRRPRMSAIDRAAQFSPFAALTGYDAAVKETARLTEERIELDEYAKSELDERLQLIQENITGNPAVSVTYFVPDDKKTGGAYCVCSGCVRKIDIYKHFIVMCDGTQIPIGEIIGIDCEYI